MLRWQAQDAQLVVKAPQRVPVQLLWQHSTYTE
jgi:hypothetical protein